MSRKKTKRSFMRITIERIDVSENGFEYPTLIKVIEEVLQ